MRGKSYSYLCVYNEVFMMQITDKNGIGLGEWQL